jgi:hypothetical protein
MAGSVQIKRAAPNASARTQGVDFVSFRLLCDTSGRNMITLPFRADESILQRGFTHIVNADGGDLI